MAAEQTDTNAVLSIGLALVGLLGVAGALLPPDMIPGNSESGSQDSVSQPIHSEPRLQPESIQVTAPEQAVAEPAPPPLKEPDPVPERTSGAATPASPLHTVGSALDEAPSGPAAVSGMLNAPAQMIEAAKRALAGKKATSDEPVAEDVAIIEADETVLTVKSKTAMESPLEKPTSVEMAQPVVSRPRVPQAAPTRMAPYPAPVPLQVPVPWGPWQAPAFPPPVFPRPYAPHPQWGMPQPLQR